MVVKFRRVLNEKFRHTELVTKNIHHGGVKPVWGFTLVELLVVVVVLVVLAAIAVPLFLN